MLLIKNARIFTMEDSIIDRGYILVEDGKIKEVGQGDFKEPEGLELIDASGKNIYPGFIDAHSHIGLSEDGIGAIGRDHNERTDPISPNMNVVDGINPRDRTLREAYEAGVTCAMACPGSANPMGGMTAVIKLYGDRIDDMLVKSPAAMKIAFGENPKRVYNAQSRTPRTRMATAAVLREAFFKAERYLDLKEAGKNPDYDPKLEAISAVLRKDIAIKAHAHRADDIFTAIRIAKEFDLDLTIDHCTDGIAIKDELAREGYPCIIGPSLGHRSKPEVKNKTYRTPGVLNKAGVKIAITTDSPVIPLKHLSLCAGQAVRQGLDEMEALKAITINPAEIMGLDSRIGSIKEGKDADLVIIEGNPLRDLNYRLAYTIIDGKIVYKNKN